MALNRAHVEKKIPKASNGKHLTGTRKSVKDNRIALGARGNERSWKKQWQLVQLKLSPKSSQMETYVWSSLLLTGVIKPIISSFVQGTTRGSDWADQAVTKQLTLLLQQWTNKTEYYSSKDVLIFKRRSSEQIQEVLTPTLKFFRLRNGSCSISEN